MLEALRQYVRRQELLQPGDRLAVAVSGGADSVALLRSLVELKSELGIVLSVAHFHHGIRGAEADADQQFVRELADGLGLEFHLGSGDAPSYARSRQMSLETAARELRHSWFAQLIAEQKAVKIATAHTLDDQAETVLMRLVRGSGIHGLSGIYPVQQEKRLIRPLLAITRREVENYLCSLNQSWREDSTNLDLSHTRNRVRHQLLPMLERDFNAGIRGTLADLAEIARAESKYWREQTSAVLPRVVRPGKPSRSGRTVSGEASRTLALDLAALTALPLALQRQVLLHVTDGLGSREFLHVQQLIDLAQKKSGSKRLALPGGLVAVRSFRELQISMAEGEAGAGSYQYALKIPGETPVPELGSIIHARLIHVDDPDKSSHDFGSLLKPELLGAELIVRNWRAGDKFFPARTRQPKKVKELLQPARLGRQISPTERKSWPVLESASAGQIVWVRGFAVPESLAARSGRVVLIEESQFDVRSAVRNKK